MAGSRGNVSGGREPHQTDRCAIKGLSVSGFAVGLFAKLGELELRYLHGQHGKPARRIARDCGLPTGHQRDLLGRSQQFLHDDA